MRSRHSRRPWETLYAVAVCVALALVLAGTIAWRPAPAGHVGAGRPRNVDVERMERLLREGRLSDEPAVFWRALGEPGAAADPASSVVR